MTITYENTVPSGSDVMRLIEYKEHDLMMVQLFATKDKYTYYKKFGFEERPSDAPGMRWISRED
ncbi:hypothetical protein BVG16_12140 [Paenibacillus selenitireducens]|uniref:N-acetyltransferase domain-containing protein n=1 Tax=Paenibacillus selenitireducens TaxID=1324314 RepID=A0A1T2XFJ7_9BACL|nr:hypothetical protein [Paenibacillus selenitireducens]OPA78608.1 hypothetical protein BVG16_12140 [Paenibacillus selenitireducens]